MTGTMVDEPRIDQEAVRDLTIAVVIPCHNYAHLLPEAVTSVLGQTRQVNNLVIVDDSSTDDTAGVAHRFSGAAQYIRIEGGGPSSARNAGARAVDTDLVVFLDADDRLEPTFVETCVKALPEDWDR